MGTACRQLGTADITVEARVPAIDAIRDVARSTAPDVGSSPAAGSATATPTATATATDGDGSTGGNGASGEGTGGGNPTPSVPDTAAVIGPNGEPITVPVELLVVLFLGSLSAMALANVRARNRRR